MTSLGELRFSKKPLITFMYLVTILSADLKHQASPLVSGQSALTQGLGRPVDQCI